MRGLSSWVEGKRLTQDKFQSFVCWMLLLGALMAMLPPTFLVILETAESGCSGAGNTEFIVYAHYSTHHWLTSKFNAFKTDTDEAFDKMCYELIIADSELDSTKKPTMWMPENSLWIDIAETDADTTLIDDRTSDCLNTTNVPFGIITWKILADLISTDGGPLPFEDIINLAKYGWVNITNGNVKNYYPDVDGLTFAHGHPNVTSGGLLG
eukprot:544639_1